MTYKFKYKRRLFFRSFKVIGHSYNKELDRMALHFQNGSIRELPKWSACECLLGSDWALAVKEEMERKSGQEIIVHRDLDAK